MDFSVFRAFHALEDNLFKRRTKRSIGYDFQSVIYESLSCFMQMWEAYWIKNEVSAMTSGVKSFPVVADGGGLVECTTVIIVKFSRSHKHHAHRARTRKSSPRCEDARRANFHLANFVGRAAGIDFTLFSTTHAFIVGVSWDIFETELWKFSTG